MQPRRGGPYRQRHPDPVSGEEDRRLCGRAPPDGGTGTDSLGVAPGIVTNLAHWLLDELEVGTLYTGHCTGAPAFALLEQAGGGRVRPLTTGAVVEL